MTTSAKEIDYSGEGEAGLDGTAAATTAATTTAATTTAATTTVEPDTRDTHVCGADCIGGCIHKKDDQD